MAEISNVNESRLHSVLKAAVIVTFVAAAIGGWWVLRDDGAVARLFDAAWLREYIRAVGAWGPIVVIGLMTAAILISPLPSAPIALAAGAAYGHTLGTLYVAVGSELGALGAFALARYLGHEFIHHRFGESLSRGLQGSQRMLMGTVFVSRLLPFVSFDVVSYAAGLTVLTFWRFAIATLAGILPASFLLAHLGSELADADLVPGLLVVTVLGALGIASMLVRGFRRGEG